MPRSKKPYSDIIEVYRPHCPRCKAWRGLKCNRSRRMKRTSDSKRWVSCQTCGHKFIVLAVAPYWPGEDPAEDE